MKKKLMMVAVLLGALSLGACVDDNESQSVIDVRNAKAKQLEALAEQAKLQGEAAKITAEAQKAYQEAYAKYLEAQAEHEGALTEQIREEIRQSKAKFDAELDALKAEYEKRYWIAKNKAKENELAYLDQIETRLVGLYVDYSNAADELARLEYNRADLEYLLAKAEISSANLAELVALQIKDKEAEIQEAEIKIAAWQKYQGIDLADIKAQEQELLQAKYAAYKVKADAQDKKDVAEEAYDKLVNLYDADEDASTVKAVAAVQKYKKYATTYSFGYFNSKSEAWAYVVEYAKNYNVLLSSAEFNNLINLSDPNSDDYGRYGLWNMVTLPDYSFTWMVCATDYVYLNDKKTLSVPYYYLTNADQQKVTQIYADDVAAKAEDLGAAASEGVEATGAYATLAAAEKTLADNKAALEKAKADVVTLEADNAKALAAIEAAEVEVNKANEALEAIQKEIAGYESEKTAAESQKEYWEREKEVANGYKSNADWQKTIATGNKSTAQTNLDNAKTELANATTDAEKKAAQKNIDAAQKDLDAANADLKDAETRIAAAQKDIDAAVAKINAEQAKIDAAQAKIDAANVKANDAQAVCEKAQRALDNVIEQNNAALKAYAKAKEKVTSLESTIKSNEQSIADAKDGIDKAKKALNDAKEVQTAWIEMVDALSGDNKAAYEAEVKALVDNEIVTAYVAAIKAYDEAVEAYAKADAEAQAAHGLIADKDNVKDAAAEIRTLQETIATKKKELEELKSTVTTFVETEHTQGNYNVEYSTIDLERYIKYLKAQIEKLANDIKVQEEIVKLAKTRLDAAIASQPAE